MVSKRVSATSSARCRLARPVNKGKRRQDAARASAVPSKRCPSCGGTDHSRWSSKKCRYFNKRASRDATDVASPTVAASALETTEVARLESEEEESILSRPNFIKIATPNRSAYEPVIDVSSPNFEPVPTIFQVKGTNDRGRTVEIDPTPSVMADLFFSLSLIEHITKCSNQYMEHRRKQCPDLFIWKRSSISAPFTLSCTYQFIAMLYYFGVVRLPCKRDYWSANSYMP